MVVHSCVNGKMNGKVIKQHTEDTDDIVCLIQARLFPCNMNQTVFCLCVCVGMCVLLYHYPFMSLKCLWFGVLFAASFTLTKKKKKKSLHR